MPRYFLDISYKGTNYHGWQIQDNANTVQTELEKALSTILRIKTPVMGSGRTDTGVHAQQQIVHFEFDGVLEEIPFKLNSLLPYDITVNGVREVNPEAHARFDATQRAYEYHLHQKRNPFKEGLSYFYAKPLNVDLMNHAASHLIGEQDFQSFSKVKTEVNNFICTIEKAEWISHNDSLVFCVTANRFLRGMVRALVGTLLEVGLKKMSPEEFKAVIEKRDRKMAGRSVPPEGLYLTTVVYPSQIYI